ncbi:acetyl-CoA acetyltransferase [Qipengyuania sp. DSG2-2]|uniref:acetyl-CoA acetyltransferase n=1 Tax=Qipengyuania sp. DGS2-2 TaxID=3349631 RepID=UPI0036D363FD
MTTPLDPRTPVIIGVGQFSEKLDDAEYAALSPMDMAGRALGAAIADAQARGDVASALDTLGAIRQFEISTPVAIAPFGKADNPPRAIAQRVGADPARAILEYVGGQAPQRLVGEFAQDIAEGRAKVAAVVGSEAISTTLALVAKGEKPDWSEELGGQMEDRGFGMKGVLDSTLIAHGVRGAIPAYALMENARRKVLGRSLEEHRAHMAQLFAPFTEVAASNPHAAAPVARTAEEIATPTERNRIVAEPYTKSMIARDQVNQSAAIIVASVEAARELGVPEDRWVHIHAVSDAKEASPMQRADLHLAPSAVDCAHAALDMAGSSVAEIAHFDIYSCFPIPVCNLIEALDIAEDDPRGLTLTGGLPFFGGAGNNYSAHGIAEAVARCRSEPGSRAMVIANGGFMSKYATGIYSTEPADWSQQLVKTCADQADAVAALDQYDGPATIETYTIQNSKKGPRGTVIARTPGGERVAAIPADAPALALLETGDPFGANITIAHDDDLNRFSVAG